MMELERHQISAHVVSRPFCPLLLALLPLLGACGDKPPTPPPYEANPAPKEAYEVVVTVHDGPEDIYVNGAGVAYRIANSNCLPPIDNFEGVSYGIEKHSLDIPLKKTDAHTFSGIYFRDGLADKNYFGRGVCRWVVEYVSASIETESTKSYTYFAISTDPEERTATRFSRRDISPRLDDGERYPASDFSEERFNSEVPIKDQGDFFSYSITITPMAGVQ
ncbi:hypothetical protein [Stenotrophomonas sp. ZAC14D2_NAIMI4_7]|uniref:hypothetical protein n=1 Tax=Stenotrophomonas sp. ZAC14D2_NAIMI4_7 TaxID=2072405 RepID=UPI00131ED39C|nr:hypothetical protein [Stenotrophomonas sp. ZAC14D2_NAIMI4_7]